MASRCVWILVLAALCVGALCVDAFAATWFSDTFDTYSVSNLVGQGGWSGTAGAVRVQTGFVKSVKSVQASYRLWGVGDAYRNVSSGSGYHYIDFDAAMDITVPAPPAVQAPKGEDVGYVKILTSGSVEITRFVFSRQQFKVLLGPSPGSPTVILDDVPNQTWYHIRIGINLATSRMDVWVDDIQRISQGRTYNTNTASSITRLLIGQWNTAGTKLDKSQTYVDNLTGNSPTHIATGAAYKVLSPSMFPTWQGWNVLYPFVIQDSSASGYRMYYSGTGSAQNNDSISDQWMTGSVTSSNTTAWTLPDNYEPILIPRKLYEGDLIDPQDMSTQFDSMFAIGACVLKESAASYKMWYTGWNGDTESIGGGKVNRTSFRIGYATSSNGTVWTKQPGVAGAGAIFGLGASGQQDAKGVGQPCVLRDGSSYRMWYEGFDGTYWRIFYATSSDGITWTRQGPAHLDRGGPGALDELGVRNPVVVLRNGQYEMWYQGQSSSAPNYHVLRATSPNGLSWGKVGTEVTLHPDDSIDGSEMIHVDSAIVNWDNTVQLFFAKQNTRSSPHVYTTIYMKSYYIYTEVIP